MKPEERAIQTLAQLVRHDDRDGGCRTFDDVIDDIISSMNSQLSDLINGSEYNGMRIQNEKNIPFYLIQILKPVSGACLKLMEACNEAGGFTTLTISYNENLKLKRTHSIDMVSTEKKLLGAVAEWMTAVEKIPEDKRPQGYRELIARKSTGGLRLSDLLILTCEKGWALLPGLENP